MVTDKQVLSVQMFLLSAYLSCWYGGVLPAFINEGAINYIFLGFYGALLMIMAGIVIFVDANWGKWLNSLVVLFNVLPLVLLTIQSIPLYLIPWLMMIQALFQGVLMGLILHKSLNLSFLRYNLPFFLLGSLGVILTEYLPFEVLNIKAVSAANDGKDLSNIYLLMIIFFFLLVFGIAEFFIQPHINREQNVNSDHYGFAGVVKYFIIILTGILVLTEVMFFFWSVVLKNDNQGLATSLTFPLTILVIFICRVFLKKAENKISNIGWLFTLSIVLTVSVGMFYTFSFTSIFIIGFGISTAYLLFINNTLFHITMDAKKILYLLGTGSVIMIVCGLYTQNHIEFIRSINMPEAVIILSARQALVKELASFAGISVILSGILFLKRRTIFN